MWRWRWTFLWAPSAGWRRWAGRRAEEKTPTAWTSPARCVCVGLIIFACMTSQIKGAPWSFLVGKQKVSLLCVCPWGSFTTNKTQTNTSGSHTSIELLEVKISTGYLFLLQSHITHYSLVFYCNIQHTSPAPLWKQHNATNDEKRQIASWISLVFYFIKIGKRWNQYKQHFSKVPTGVTNMVKILYVLHVEIFPCFSALPAASPTRKHFESYWKIMWSPSRFNAWPTAV